MDIGKKVHELRLRGYAAKDASVRDLKGGGRVVNISLPLEDSYGDRANTNWYELSIWDHESNKSAQYRFEAARDVRKGDIIEVVGPLKAEMNEGRSDGKMYLNLYVTAEKFVNLSAVPKNRDNNSGGNNSGGGRQQNSGQASGRPGNNQPSEDDVPF